MTQHQEHTIRNLCQEFGTTFDPTHYSPAEKGWLRGWVGGRPGTAMVNVSPAGDVERW